ncbi:ATP-binding protein [Streptomyces sp. HPF1205]|uniref:ATP-binding protein n=1 Tax=Streptomyces sp. HPF1205 TaxID=2873262 RepID=UPI001CEC1654|nr:ATP-binding protein [Streptomyces sp. HPF1205]
MARSPLPSILKRRPAPARGRELARTVGVGASDVLHPVITIARGMGRQAAWTGAWWSRTPKDRRGPALLLAAAALVVVLLMPYGPALAVVALVASAAWLGRERRVPATGGPTEAEGVRLQSLYEALVPYLSDPGDPAPLYAHDGGWEQAFGGYAFEDGRLTRLTLRYPAYFTDGEAGSRARVEALLHAKAGRGREYRFDWNEEENHLTLTALAPLATDVAAQRFVTAPGETVLGFTDEDAVGRTVPVVAGGAADPNGTGGPAGPAAPAGSGGRVTRDAPPVVWRTGPRSTEPHLLALGQPGTGTTTLLRSIALQALAHGDIVVIDGGGSGEYAALAGRPGVLAVENGLLGASATLEWAAHETERRLIAVNRARQSGRRVADDVRRPLWILVDRPTALTQLAAAEGRPDPQTLLDVPLRHGRTASVAVAVADQLDATEALAPVVIAQTRARVVLGRLAPEHVEAVLGAPQRTTPAADVPPGRGYARLGTGPVLRLQVPATPDPYDEEAPGAAREAVLSLLPGAPPVSLVKHPSRAPAPEPEPGPEPVPLGKDPTVLRAVADLELG